MRSVDVLGKQKALLSVYIYIIFKTIISPLNALPNKLPIWYICYGKSD